MNILLVVVYQVVLIIPALAFPKFDILVCRTVDLISVRIPDMISYIRSSGNKPGVLLKDSESLSSK